MNTPNEPFVEDIAHTYGERLKLALSARGRSQTDLARAVGVTPQSIQYICAGKTKRGSTRTHAIARYLGVNARWLSEGKGPMEAPSTLTYLDMFERLSEEDRAMIIRMMAALLPD